MLSIKEIGFHPECINAFEQSNAFIEKVRNRIIEGSIPEPNTGCWLWEGKIKDGYPLFELDAGFERFYRAHRVSYTFFKEEEIPSELTLDHKCRQTLCVNPDHLEPVTLRENVLRAWEVSRQPGNERKGQCDKYVMGGTCKHGHILSEETAYQMKRGDLQCKKCRALSKRKHMTLIIAPRRPVGRPKGKKRDNSFVLFGTKDRNFTDASGTEM